MHSFFNWRDEPNQCLHDYRWSDLFVGIGPFVGAEIFEIRSPFNSLNDSEVVVIFKYLQPVKKAFVANQQDTRKWQKCDEKRSCATCA